MKILQYCLLAFLWPVTNGAAQSPPAKIIRLGIGDQVPDVLLSNLYNYPASSISFSKLIKELTIIDFWATWCGSCLESIPEMHALQNQFEGRLQVLMVNSFAEDNVKKVKGFFEKRKQRFGQPFTLPYILQDSLLKQIFPHEAVPHYVWIDKNRRVLAITTQEEVNAFNIQAFLDGKKLALHVKNDDLLFNGEKDELIKAGATKANDFLYRSMLTGYMEDMGAVIGKNPGPDGTATRFYIINYSLLALYQMAFPEILKLPLNQIIIEPSAAPAFYSNIALKEKKLYCYDLMTTPVLPNQMEASLRTDLLRYFNITVNTEKRLMSCYILSADRQLEKAISKGGIPAGDTDPKSLNKYIRNSNIKALTSVLSIILNKPWVDETGLSGNIDISFPYHFFEYNLQQINEFLSDYGMLITEDFRRIDMAVLKAVPTNPQ